MKNVLTGASGFIGGAFLRSMLGPGTVRHQMICLSSSDGGQEKLRSMWPDIEVYPLRSIQDQRTRDAIKGADALIHCGWSTVPRTADADPAKDLQENVIDGIALIEAAATAGIGRFIFLSSGGTVYGNGSNKPFRESDVPMPRTAYGISKLAFEQYLRIIAQDNQMRYIVLRPGNIYGRVSDPLRPQGVIEHWMHRIIRDEALEVWSSPNVVRDLVHIDDLVKVLEHALVYEGQHTLFNVGSGKGTSLGELLDMLTGLAQRDLHTAWNGSDREQGPDINILDAALLGQEFGLRSNVPLPEGLRQLWAALMADHERRSRS